MTILETLTKIDSLTKEQGGLIASDDKSALENNLAAKEELIAALKALPQPVLDEKCRAVLESIASAELKNVRLAKDEMGRLRELMKKTKEGKTTVRGYDSFSSGVGATYIDRKK
jgi:hypothetical protein